MPKAIVLKHHNDSDPNKNDWWSECWLFFKVPSFLICFFIYMWQTHERQIWHENCVLTEEIVFSKLLIVCSSYLRLVQKVDRRCLSLNKCSYSFPNCLVASWEALHYQQIYINKYILGFCCFVEETCQHMIGKTCLLLIVAFNQKYNSRETVFTDCNTN